MMADEPDSPTMRGMVVEYVMRNPFDRYMSCKRWSLQYAVKTLQVACSNRIPVE